MADRQVAQETKSSTVGYTTMRDGWKIIGITLGLSLVSVLFWWYQGRVDWFEPVPDLATDPIELQPGYPYVVDGGFDRGQYGCIANWDDVEQIATNTWYLACNGDGGQGSLVEEVDLQDLGIGYGPAVMSVDKDNCGGMCSTSVVQLVPAREGIEYTLSADGYVVEGNTGSLYLDFLNSSRSRIAVETTGGYVQDEWRRVSVSGTAPYGTEFIRVILYTSNKALGTMVWDNVELN